jgi:DNA ligase-1
MIEKLWAPMCAAHPKDTGAGINAALDEVIKHLPKPLLGSIKYDGIRCTVQNGKLYSRTLKLIPNLELQEKWGFPEFNGLDCEIVVGGPGAPDAFNRTTSVVMSRDADAAQAVLYVIDKVCHGDHTFDKRHHCASKVVQSYHNLDVQLIQQKWLQTIDEVAAFEKLIVEQGHEGVMLRDPYAKYKHGRSTVKEGGLIAIKRFVDAEATIVSVFQMMENTNEKQTNELGRSKRSHAQEGMVGKNTLGGFTVDLLGPRGGKLGRFNIGTGIGLTAEYRRFLWARRKSLKGKIIKLRYQAVGSMDAPRLPIFTSFRDRRDM